MSTAAARTNPVVTRLKEAASHTVIYGLGSVLQTALGFVLIPVYTRYFTPELYGVFSLLTLAGTVAGSVFFAGGSSALSRSYYDYDDSADRRVVVTTSLVITAAGAAAQIVLGALFAGAIARALFGDVRYASHVALALASSAVAFVNALLYVVLRFERRSVLVVVMNVVTLVLATVLIVGLLASGDGVMAPILGGLIAQLVSCAALLVACRSALAPAISRPEVSLQLRFGLMAVATGLGYYVLDSVDRVFIAKLCSMNDVGVYSLGYKIGMIIHIVFIMPFAQIWAPMRMQYRDDPTSTDLFRLVLTYYWLIGILATAVLSVFSREIIAVAARRADYAPAFRVVPFVMLAHLFYGVLNIVDFGVFVSRKIQYHVALFWSVLVLNVAANYLLIGRFGYMAAAWTTLGSYVVLAAAMFVVANRFYAFPVEWRRVATIVLSGAAVLATSIRLSTAISVQIIVTKAALLVALAAVWYFAVLTDGERRRLAAVLAPATKMAANAGHPTSS